ncbi:MAG: hypothetical protein KDA78_17565, partial [Planctomycetaceae bacterium]|nr:hypothetical protein [Planctomycetaceae bacterium]
LIEATPHGNILCLVLEDNRIQVWNTSKWQVEYTAVTGANRISALAVAPNGTWLVAHCDNEFHAWDISDASRRDFPEITCSVPNAISISPNNNSIMIGGQDLQSWDLQPVNHRWTVPVKPEGPQRLLFDRDSSPFERVSFSADGQSIFVVRGNFDRSVSVISAEDGSVTRVFTGHTAKVFDIASSPDGNSIASSSEDRSVRLWSIQHGGPFRQLRGFGPPGGQGELLGSIVQLGISPDCRYILTGSYDHSTRLWDASNGELKEVIFTRADFLRITTPWKHIVRKIVDQEDGQRSEPRWKVAPQLGELVFEDAQTSDVIAWYPEPVARCITHPIGFVVGAIENHMYLLAVEGGGFCFDAELHAEQERIDRIVAEYDNKNIEDSDAVDLREAHELVAEAIQIYRDALEGENIELFGVSTAVIGERQMLWMVLKHVMNLLESAEITFARLSEESSLEESRQLRREVQSKYHNLEEDLLLGTERDSSRAMEVSKYAIADGAITEAIGFEDRKEWQSALDAYKRAEKVYRELNDSKSLEKCLNFQAGVLSAMYRSMD